MSIYSKWNSWHISIGKYEPFLVASPDHLQEIKMGPIVFWRTKNMLADICNALRLLNKVANQWRYYESL
jgi:hypothetical protein